MDNRYSEPQPAAITLGNNLDQLLFATNYKTGKTSGGGLFLPSEGNPGTGNIVIKGSPGTGKSTLAMQFLYQTVCGQEESRLPPGGYFALYFSLEEQIDHIINKTRAFGWTGDSSKCQVRKLIHLHNTDETTSPKNLAEYIKKILTQPENCRMREFSTCKDEKDGADTDKDTKDRICKSHNENMGGIYKNISSRVLLPMLSPKSIDTGDGKSTYWERYKQIEKYLFAADYIKRQKTSDKPSGPMEYGSIPELKMICIDSLNVFGDKQLDRVEIFRLFDLFKRYGVLGVFIFESNQDHVGNATLQMSDDIDFAADVVISLHNELDKGYSTRYFEVVKSRYIPQVYGKHPYYIVTHTENAAAAPQTAGTAEPAGGGEPSYLPFWVYPSMHYKLNEFVNAGIAPAEEAADKSGEEDGNGKRAEGGDSPEIGKAAPDPKTIATVMEAKFAGWKRRFGNIMPSSFKRICVIMISGYRNTFKSTIARDFLLQGLEEEAEEEVEEEAEENADAANGCGDQAVIVNGLFISMEDKHYGEPSEWWQYKKSNSGTKPAKGKGEPGVSMDSYHRDDTVVHEPGMGRQILDIRKWTSRKNPDKFIISIIIKKKAITAEEFIHHLQYNVLEKYKNIRRVILDEVNMIGVSYPFLQSSNTSGQLFLNALVALLKKMDIDLIITGTIGELPQGDEVISRAVSLSDLTLNTKFCDVFGKQNVIITGGGLIANQKHTASDKLIPGVLRIIEEKDSKKRFSIDNDHLKGLIGFEQGKVYRPGLTINLFEEGELQREYNNQITSMYNLAFPGHASRDAMDESAKNVCISSFNDISVEAMRETVERIRINTPLEGTVVSMVDEYWGSPRPCCAADGKGSPQECFWDNSCIKKGANCPRELRRLYYTNCLVLAYRKKPEADWLKTGKELLSWEDIHQLAEAAKPDFPEIQTKTSGEKSTDLKLCLLDADFFITETLSCLLLDTIVAAYKQAGADGSPQAKTILEKAYDDFKTGAIGDHLLKQFYCLNIMFSDLDKQYVREKYNANGKFNKMHANSLMYICWYTQLRDFLKNNPELIPEIGVVCLPGGGFSGDWLIEVMPGSLSNVLGTNTLELLCKPEEEIKRFVQGVGLPSWLNTEEYKKYNMKKPDSPGSPVSDDPTPMNIDFIGKLPAWIGARDITLDDIGGIYRNANRRKSVKNYEKYRYMLSVAFRRLMSIKHRQMNYEIFKKEAEGILKELISYLNAIG